MAAEAYTQTVQVGAHVVTISQVEDHGETARYALTIDDVLRGYIVHLPGSGRRWRLRSLPGDHATDDLPGFWREDGRAMLFRKLAKEAVVHLREGRMRSAAEMADQTAPVEQSRSDGFRLLREIVTAWDTLPEAHHSLDAVQNWLATTMAPAIEEARAALAERQS